MWGPSRGPWGAVGVRVSLGVGPGARTWPATESSRPAAGLKGPGTLTRSRATFTDLAAQVGAAGSSGAAAAVQTNADLVTETTRQAVGVLRERPLVGVGARNA
jgi:hypothetical protein